MPPAGPSKVTSSRTRKSANGSRSWQTSWFASRKRCETNLSHRSWLLRLRRLTETAYNCRASVPDANEMKTPESNPAARVWKKIALFYALTLVFSNVFNAFVLFGGRMDAGNLLYVTGAMWSPGLAALATKRFFREPIGDLPWNWGGARPAWLAYLIPLAYALPVYLIVWLTPLGGFLDADFLKRTAEQFGWSNLPPTLVLVLFVIFTATLGLVGKTSRALGEEIGWRGFLVPELSKVVGFTGVGLISGLMWAVYHFPVLLFGDYNKGAPAWYSLICFTLMV